MVDGLGWPTDTVADKNKHCVYISDRYGMKTLQQDKPGIFILMESGKYSCHPLSAQPAGLSITQDGLLLVVCEHEEKKGRSLRFFRSDQSSDDSAKLEEVVERRIDLSIQIDRYLLQAVALNSERFVISQVHKKKDTHCIVVADNNGNQVSL